MVLDFRKRIIMLTVAVASLLLIPLVAMQLGDEVVWTPFDFAVAGVLLFGTGLMYVLATRKAGDAAYRLAFGAAVATALFLVWTNLAVGLIGNEREQANLMYFGVLAVAFNGAIIARLQPRGMMFAMFAAALAVVVVAAIALLAGMQHYPESSVAQIIVVNGFFVELFVVTALLFRNAATTKQVAETGVTQSVKPSTKDNDVNSDIICWTFGLVFIVIGVLNLFLVHPVPGIFYLLLSLPYFPLASVILRRRFGFAIPLAAKFVVGFVVLWATLAVGDLADILGL